MWGYLRLRWWLSETSKNTTPPRAPNGTKKGRCRTKKRPIQKKGHYRTSPLKNGLTKLPCFLKILVSWGDFFDNGLLLYPVQDHTMQCCTRKPFWVAKLEPQSCSASAFPYFEADAELGVLGLKTWSIESVTGKITWSKLRLGARRLFMADGRGSIGSANVLLGKKQSLVILVAVVLVLMIDLRVPGWQNGNDRHKIRYHGCHLFGSNTGFGFTRGAHIYAFQCLAPAFRECRRVW